MKYKSISIIVIIILLTFLLSIVVVNIHVKNSNDERIVDISELEDTTDYHIIVLGASVSRNGVSKMLEDRLTESIEVYEHTNNDILVSGDSSKDNYDETTSMYNYLVENGIPAEKIEIDKYGLSTYDSIKRSKDIYKYDKIIIVTQKYHLYRALYIAKSLDIEAYGKLVFESGYSSIHNYECGCPELITLYDIMTQTDGIYGGRFSGAGFKGCCMSIVDPDKIDQIIETVSREYLKVYPELEGRYMAAVCDSADGVDLGGGVRRWSALFSQPAMQLAFTH